VTDEVDVPRGVLAARERLQALDGLPVPEHVEAFDQVHRLLQDALASLDEA
jgi:hypothetical protein